MTNEFTGTHLDADKALECPTALAWFFHAFSHATPETRAKWLETYNADYRFELGSLTITALEMNTQGLVEGLEESGITNDELNEVIDFIGNSLDNTPFSDETYRNSYKPHLSKALSMFAMFGSDPEMISLLTLLANL